MRSLLLFRIIKTPVHICTLNQKFNFLKSFLNAATQSELRITCNLLIQWLLSKEIPGTELIVSPELFCCCPCRVFRQRVSLPFGTPGCTFLQQPSTDCSPGWCVCSVGSSSHSAAGVPFYCKDKLLLSAPGFRSSFSLAITLKINMAQFL